MVEAIDGGKFNDEIVLVKVEDVFVKDGKWVSSEYIVGMDEGVCCFIMVEVFGKLCLVFV